jgi:hypothetical protein
MTLPSCNTVTLLVNVYDGVYTRNWNFQTCNACHTFNDVPLLDVGFFFFVPCWWPTKNRRRGPHAYSWITFYGRFASPYVCMCASAATLTSYSTMREKRLMKLTVANESRYSYYLQNLMCISYSLFYVMELIEFQTKTRKRTCERP